MIHHVQISSSTSNCSVKLPFAFKQLQQNLLELKKHENGPSLPKLSQVLRAEIKSINFLTACMVNQLHLFRVHSLFLFTKHVLNCIRFRITRIKICECLLSFKTKISISTTPPLSLIIFKTTLSKAFCQTTIDGKNLMCKSIKAGKCGLQRYISASSSMHLCKTSSKFLPLGYTVSVTCFTLCTFSLCLFISIFICTLTIG